MALSNSNTTPANRRWDASTAIHNPTPSEMANNSMHNKSTFTRLGDAIHDSSIWLSRRAPSTPRFIVDHPAQADDLSVNLQKVTDLMEELDAEMIQLIGVEQQMQSITLKCRLIRQNIMTKSNDIHATVEQLAANLSKEVLPKATQTDLVEMEKAGRSFVKEESGLFSSPNLPLLNNNYRKRRLSAVRERSSELDMESKVI